LLSIALIFKMFSIDILKEVSYRKTSFHIFMIFSLGILSILGYKNFKNISVENYETPKEIIRNEKKIKI
ncbi:MAG: hypothetical protein ACRDAG_13245, partial [Cetobacterium somerae]|uniref:hypothetical protein n=1 Tax=Cetobacterium somerae TaxID=188913 RepID=UPI003F2F08A4